MSYVSKPHFGSGARSDGAPGIAAALTNRNFKSTMCSLTAAGLLLGGLAACAQLPLEPRQTLVKSVAEAGETHVAVLAVTPWSEIRGDLTPDFKLTPKQALDAALPRVSAYEEKVLDLFAAKLGLGLPQSSVAATRSTNLADGAITGSVTESQQPGQLPGADVLPELRGADRSLRDLPGVPETTRNAVFGASDPFLRYQAANAIYQYVNVLERLVANTPKLDDYDPYLATLQITSFPYARHQPYDVYLDMSFYPVGGDTPPVTVDNNNQQATQTPPPPKRTPIVVPVLITDNLQGETTSRAAEMIRQLSIAANALSGGIAGALGITSANERSAAVFGTDYTSTFTVGRTSENGLTAVLGAAKNPVSDYAMIRRTHNVSVLLFVPKSTSNATKQFAPSTEPQRRVNVLSTFDLRRPDQKGGAIKLRDKASPKSHERAQSRLAALGFPEEFVKQFSEQCVRNLFHGLTAANYPQFIEVLTGRAEKSGCAVGEGSAPVIYHVLSDVYGQSPGFRTTTIHLPRKPSDSTQAGSLSVANGLTVAAFDNEAAGRLSIVLPGATGRVPADFSAVLTLRSKAGARTPLVAEAARVAKGRLNLAFPSPLSLGMKNARETGGTMTLRWKREEKGANGNAKIVSETRTYKVVYQSKAAPKKPADAVKPTPASATVTIGSDGSLKMQATGTGAKAPAKASTAAAKKG